MKPTVKQLDAMAERIHAERCRRLYCYHNRPQANGTEHNYAEALWWFLAATFPTTSAPARLFS